MTRKLTRSALCAGIAVAIGTTGIWVALPSSAATNNGLSIGPLSGNTLSGAPSFAVPAPGCNGTANTASVTVAGTGVTASNSDGSTNIIGGTPTTPGDAISIGSGGQAWDGLMPSNLTRPLNGTFNVKVQCLEDGDATGLVFFDRDITFTGASNTWAAVADPTPTPVVTPTPPPTPTPVPTPTPTPAPGSANENVTVVVPDTGGTGGGSFTISTGAAPTINMGAPTTVVNAAGNYLDYNVAAIPTVTLTDSRPGLLAWAVVGQMGNFNPGLIFGRYFGWTPALVGTANQGATVGDPVLSGYPGTGSGLRSGRVLASTIDGHPGDTAGTAATMTAALNLHVPTNVPPQIYNGVLTVTAIS